MKRARSSHTIQFLAKVHHDGNGPPRNEKKHIFRVGPSRAHVPETAHTWKTSTLLCLSPDPNHPEVPRSSAVHEDSCQKRTQGTADRIRDSLEYLKLFPGRNDAEVQIYTAGQTRSWSTLSATQVVEKSKRLCLTASEWLSIGNVPLWAKNAFKQILMPCFC